MIERQNIIRILALVLFVVSNVVAAGSLSPRVPSKPTRVAIAQDTTYYASIMIKFHEGTGVKIFRNKSYVKRGWPKFVNHLIPKLTRKRVSGDIVRVKRLLQRHHLNLRPLFSQTKEWRLQRLKKIGEKRSGRQLTDFTLYFKANVGGYVRNVAKLIRALNAIPSVEVAYADVPAYVNGGDNPNPPVSNCERGCLASDAPGLLLRLQGYLEPAPKGIDAFAAWDYPGGTGIGVKVADIEAGYRWHYDLPRPIISTGVGGKQAFRYHAQSVQGIINSRHNRMGVHGIAPDALYANHSIGTDEMDYGEAVMKVWDENGEPKSHVANVMELASETIGMGDVILLELQKRNEDLPKKKLCIYELNSECQVLPVEYWDAEFNMIELLVANGFNVVEAAANYSVNLDHRLLENRFNRDIRDSGAILVSATMENPENHSYQGRFSAGSRIDAHAWGDNVLTTGFSVASSFYVGQNNSYRYFNGTSSASAIVAGAVASLQGAAKEKLGYPLKPSVLRQILSETGEQSVAGEYGDINIGSQPNLKMAIESL